VGQATKPRRSAGEGAIYDTADGRLRGSLIVDFPDGRTKRVYVSGRTRADVVRKLDAKRKESASGALTGETLEAYLTRWLQAHETRIRPSTQAEYRRIVRQYWLGAGFALDLGKRSLTRLQPLDVEQRMAELLARKLSPTTVPYARGVLRRALNDGMREGVVNRNVAALARPPRVASREMRALSPAEASRLLSGTVDDPLGPLYAVALGTGCRLGELLGLAWTDLLADSSALTVRRALAESGRIADDKGHRHTEWSLAEPKTRRSRRTVMVPTFVRAALRRQKAAQAVQRLAAGTAWQDEADLIFTDSLGRPMRPDAVSRAFHETATRLGLQPIRFHDLRHSAASLMLAQGVPLKTVSETLGHASIAITADTYAHVTPELRREAADALDRALSAQGQPTDRAGEPASVPSATPGEMPPR
jgi:integrase